MKSDQHGNAFTVSSLDAGAAYDTAVDHLLHFRPEVSDALGMAISLDPACPMAHVMAAYLGVLGTEPDDTAAARRDLDVFSAGLDTDRLSARERQHVHAAHALVRGDLGLAGGVLREVVREHPRDALALAIGHQIDFFTGNAEDLRDRIGGALSAWREDDQHYGLLLGMYAFGLEENGLYDRSLDVGLEALDRDSRDVWGVHAVAHTYEMTGRFGIGLRFLDDRASDWQRDNFLHVHNWWHYCLYLLEAGDSGRVREVYDDVLHNAESDGLVMEMLDAAALLWRLYLEGSDETDRWKSLATAWDAKITTPNYAFNDMHAVMSYVGAGRIDDAQSLVEARSRYVAEADDLSVTNVAMTRDIGLPVGRALVAFGRAEYQTTVALLAPIRTRVNRFGGSHAQRDAVQRTLLEAALRSGQHDLARMLVSERLGINPCSPYSWLKRASLADALGDRASEASARVRAQALRT